MDHSVHSAVVTVLEETGSAYRSFSDFNSANTDFAEFAGMALAQFKTALRRPELTREDLQSMLRRGMVSHRTGAGIETGEGGQRGWATFMASYVTQAANEGGNSPC